MSRAHIWKLGAAALAAAALVAVPVAATGHTDNLYTWASNDAVDDVGGFATTSKTDASLALLPTSTLPTYRDFPGMEICDDQGYAINTDGERRLLLWDHTTGEVTGGVQLSIDPGDDDVNLDFVGELDALADCTLLAIAGWEGDETSGSGIVSIDKTTGVVTPVVEFTDDFGDSSIATDSISGITYLFVESEGGVLAYSVVDLAAGTYTAPVAMTGWAAFYESTGFPSGSDFDSAGGLWLVTGVNELQEYHLNSFAAGADFATATPVDAGDLPYQNETLLINYPIPLAADHGAAVIPAAPTLPDTGLAFSPELLFAVLLLLGAGVTLAVLGRSRSVE